MPPVGHRLKQNLLVPRCALSSVLLRNEIERWTKHVAPGAERLRTGVRFPPPPPKKAKPPLGGFRVFVAVVGREPLPGDKYKLKNFDDVVPAKAARRWILKEVVGRWIANTRVSKLVGPVAARVQAAEAARLPDGSRLAPIHADAQRITGMQRRKTIPVSGDCLDET